MCLCPFFAGCPLGDQTIFYELRGPVFRAQDVAAYNVDVTDIVVSWHSESAAEALAHHASYRTDVIWKVSAIRPIKLAGLQFEIFKTPTGFKLETDKGDHLPRTGVFSLEIYCGSGSDRKIFLYQEISPKSLAQMKTTMFDLILSRSISGLAITW